MNPRMTGPRGPAMGPGPGMGPMGPAAYGPGMRGPPPNSIGPGPGGPGGPGPGGPGPGMPAMSMGGPGPRQPWTPNTSTVSTPHCLYLGYVSYKCILKSAAFVRLKGANNLFSVSIPLARSKSS